MRPRRAPGPAATRAGPPAGAPRPSPSRQAPRRTPPPARALPEGPRDRGTDSSRGRAPRRILSRLPRHLLTGTELSAPDLTALLDRALELKAAPWSSQALEQKVVALLFQKPSTRTRLSFEAGIVELGGYPMLLRNDEMQLSRGESVRDTALILSRHVQAIGIRTGPDALLEEIAAEGSIPV